jgi:hypothetical protein
VRMIVLQALLLLLSNSLVIEVSLTDVLNLFLLYVAVSVLVTSLARLLAPDEKTPRIEITDGNRPIVASPPVIAPEMVRPCTCGAPNFGGESRQQVSTSVVNCPPQKFYAVRRGFHPGIYYSWPDCQKQVERYPSARFKSFPTREQAERFLGVRV